MAQQIALYQQAPAAPPRPTRVSTHQPKRLCAACREKEARYGFRDDRNPAVDRPRTLCFECFRVEITRRRVYRCFFSCP